jgi:hypothetical protein
MILTAKMSLHPNLQIQALRAGDDAPGGSNGNASCASLIPDSTLFLEPLLRRAEPAAAAMVAERRSGCDGGWLGRPVGDLPMRGYDAKVGVRDTREWRMGSRKVGSGEREREWGKVGIVSTASPGEKFVLSLEHA